MFALIIGVGDDISYTIKDAQSIYNTLTDEKLIGYPKENVILLTNKKATRKGILDAFQTLRDKTDEESSILLYYSGHGGKIEGEHRFFLQPYGVTQENYLSTWLPAEELKDQINSLPSSRLVFLLDCCHAEGMAQSGIKGFFGLAQKLNDDGGIWVVASCQDNQKSFQEVGKENSIFTECLLEVLKGKHVRPFTDPKVTIMDVVEHIFEQVPIRASGLVDEEDRPCVQNPFFKTQMSENVVLSHFPKNIRDHESTVEKLEPVAQELDEDSFIRLIKAMEAIGRVEDAIRTLKKHKNIQSDPDLLENLGDMYKGKYLQNYRQKDGEEALACYLKAYDRAVETGDEEQVFTNAIKIAFLHLKLDLNQKEMRNYAQIAMEGAQNYMYASSSKYATCADACLYLGQKNESLEYYSKLAEVAGIRYRMQVCEQGEMIYNKLYKPQNTEDGYLLRLKEILLS